MRFRLKDFGLNSGRGAPLSAELLHIFPRIEARRLGPGLVILKEATETDGGGEMATQVETLLPGNPLSKPEDHGKVIDH